MMTSPSLAAQKPGPAPGEPWRGLHLRAGSNRALDELTDALPELARMGVNVLVIEVNYSFEFQSHPELRNGRDPITRPHARRFAQTCRDLNIRLIPQFQCVGHQSWQDSNGILLTTYPQFDETPGQFPNNEGIYCRSYCPRHPDINKIIFPMIDELIDAFEADAFHVGLDEVFLVGSKYCPRCRDHTPADSFAKAVNDLYDHIVKKRGIEMLMWADRLIDQKGTQYTRYEASDNGTSPAIDMIPKDIILCDWHYYRPRLAYPSIDLFLKKGFRVWPSGWDRVDSVEALIDYANARRQDGRMLGYLATTWGRVRTRDYYHWGPIRIAMKKLGGADAQYWDSHPIDEWQPPARPNSGLAALNNPPAVGKVLKEVSAADLLAGEIRRSVRWQVRGEPQDDPKTVSIIHPWRQESASDDPCAITFVLDVPVHDGPTALQFHLGHRHWPRDLKQVRFYQLLNGDRVLWERELTQHKRGMEWVVVDITDIVHPGTPLTLTFRIIDKQDGKELASQTFFGPVRVIATKP